jgi:hypothetical protein
MMSAAGVQGMASGMFLLSNKLILCARSARMSIAAALIQQKQQGHGH